VITKQTVIIDTASKAIYPSDAPCDLLPINTIGDGNCCFRAFSLLLFGTQDYHLELRVRTVLELLEHTDWYLDETNIFGVHNDSIIPFIAVISCSNTAEFDNVDFTSKDNCRRAINDCINKSLLLHSWVGMWHVSALSSVVKCKVTSIYPDIKVGIPTRSFLRYVMNRVLFPRLNALPNGNIHIMWTNTSVGHHQMWQPNHFVPCINVSDMTLFELRTGQFQTNSQISFVNENTIAFHNNLNNSVSSKKNKLSINNLPSNTRKRKKQSYRYVKKNKGKCEIGLKNECSILKDPYSGFDNKKQNLKKGDVHAKQSFTSNVAKIRNVFYDDINIKKLESCIVCGELLFKNKGKQLFLSPSTSKLHQLIFEKTQTQIAVCCNKCCQRIQKHTIPEASFLNKTEVGKVPSCLKVLNFMEKRFISQIHAFMTIVSLPSGSQYAQDGMVINFPIDLCQLHKKLPCNPYINTIAITMPGKKKSKIKGNHSDQVTDLVSKKRIIQSLLWLKANNELYHDINIDFPKQTINAGDSQCVGSSPSEGNCYHDDSFSCALPNSVSFVPCSYVPPNISINDYMNCSINEVPVVNLPRIQSQPINVFNHPKAEEMCFPWLFPYGVNGLKEERETKLSVLSYFKSRIMSADSRWRKDLSYLFWAVNVFEQHKLQEQISIAVRMKSSNSAINLSTLKAADLKNQSSNVVINDNSYSFIKSIRGTAAYWKNTLFDLLAKFRTLGPPTWFLTLSADDHHWADLINFVKLDYSDEELSHMSNIDLVRSNPVLVAQHFVHRWKSFFKNVIKNTKLNPLGEVTDYFARVEFQSRGSPHLHIFLWIKDTPDLKTPEGQNEFTKFLDKYVSTEIPSDDKKELIDLVTHLQIHKHTETCQKKTKLCRFNFPRKPCTATKLKPNVDPKTSSNFYETKRKPTDIWVNAYNPVILQLWQANMDIQFVGCAYGIASYVCSYVCKAEPIRLRQAIQDVICEINQSNLTFRQQLSKFGTKFLSQRELSAQEAAFRITGLPFVDSSRVTVSVNCKPPEKRCRILRSKKQLDQLPHESHDIFLNNIVDYYSKRPKNEIFDAMCLARFATSFIAVPSNTKLSEKSFCFQAGDKHFKKRSRPACLKVQYMTPQTDGDEYYYKLLFLYLPWYDESKLLQPYSSSVDAFLNKQSQFDPEYKEYGNFTDEVTKAVQQLRILMSDDTSTLIDSLLSNTVHQTDTEKQDHSENEDNWQTIMSKENIDSSCNTNLDDTEEDESLLNSNNNDNHMWKLLSMYTMTDSQFANSLKQLSNDQACVFNIISDHTKKQLQCQNHATQIDPYYIFVTGGAGTGKSFLISVIYEYLLRSSNSQIPVVIKTAPTGVAAYNIGGMTLHKAFKLPIDHKYKEEYTPLNGEALQELRTMFKHIQTVIIDEISMVSYRVLEQVHRRLTEITEKELAFGGLNILAFGDYFQLKPVCAPFLFFSNAVNFTHLWNDYFTPIILNSNHRQSNDSTYAHLLNNIRRGNPSQDDIHKLLERINVHINNKSFDNALRLFPTNKQCEDYNREMTDRLQSDTDCTVYHIKSQHNLLNKQYNGGQVDNDISSFIDSDDSKSSGLLETLALAIGSRVMLIRNVDVLQGLTNGAMGTIVEFHWEKENNNSSEKHVNADLPISVTVQFDNIKNHTDKNKKSFDILPISVKFFGKYNTIWERIQLPLKPCWATTIHKSQGMTLDKCVIDLSNKVFQPGMAYVALSRATSLSAISLISLDTQKIYASEHVITYYENIQSRAEQKC